MLNKFTSYVGAVPLDKTERFNLTLPSQELETNS